MTGSRGPHSATSGSTPQALHSLTDPVLRATKASRSGASPKNRHPEGSDTC